MTSDGKTVKEAIDDTILAHVGDRPFLLATNKDDKNSPLVQSPHAKRLGGKVSGLNCYKEYTCIVFISALNRKTIHQSMLLTWDLTETSSPVRP